MSTPYIGEIRMFGGNFAPAGWVCCNGQLLSISENDVLFNLIGTTYGGDGQSTFGVPNLQGRLPMHQGSGFPLAQSAGSETVTLTGTQLPSHSHPYLATQSAATTGNPSGALPAQTAGSTYASTTSAPTTTMSPQGIVQTGGNQPHDNMMPYLAVSFIISLFGIYPSQS